MSMLQRAILLGTIAGLSACGGGGGGGGEEASTGPAPNVLSGQFIDSAVNGLRYETPTRSGLTDQSGTFYYLEGEQVSFYVGGTKLGEATGADQITPFTLAGIAPVRTQTQITERLSAASSNSLDRALNIARLLQLLDQDGNANNGIDLGDAHAQLGTVTINLYQKATGFESDSNLSEARNRVGTSHSVSLDAAAQHLYESLNVNVEMQRISRYVSTLNNNQSETVTYSYDSAGRLSAENIDTNGDGQPDAVKSYQYNAQGLVASISNSRTGTTETLTYNDDGQLTQRLIDRASGTDTIESYQYVNGLLVRFERDDNADGTPEQITTYAHTSNGDVSRYEIDSDGDGNADTIAQYQYTGTQLTAFEEDRDNDGQSDLIVGYGYNTEGKRISMNLNMGNQGQANSLASFQYDANGNITRYELDSDLDGSPDYIERYKYNSQQKRSHYYRDTNADGQWDSMAQYFYDVNGNRTRMVEDTDGNGIADKIWNGDYEAVTTANAWAEITAQLP